MLYFYTAYLGSFLWQSREELIEKRRKESYEQDHEDLRRQRGGGIRRLCVLRGRSHLPHHTLQPYGGARRRVVGQRQEEHLRPAGSSGGDAVRGRRLRRVPRRTGGRCAGHQLHRLSGPDADDPHPAPYLRRASARRAARGVPHRGYPRILHLRRPLRRNELPSDGLCPALQRQCAGIRRSGCRGTFERHQGPHPVPALLRRLPYQP